MQRHDVTVHHAVIGALARVRVALRGVADDAKGGLVGNHLEEGGAEREERGENGREIW